MPGKRTKRRVRETRFDYNEMQLNVFQSSQLTLLWLACALAATPATLPVATELQVRLTTEASSNIAPGSPIAAVVTAPVFVEGAPVIPAGTEVIGTTADTVKALAAADNNGSEQIASLRLVFHQIRDKAGHQAKLAAVVSSVDNARESVDATGLIKGITASETIEARINQGINKIASRNQGFAQLLTGIEGALVQKVDPSVDYKPGVDFTLKLTEPLVWNFPEHPQLPGAISGAGLAQMVNAQPARTVAEKPPEPSDLTNLLFIGSLDQIQTAFQQAGWFPAARLGSDSKLETARALIEDRGYNEAPVSILFLDGRPPDLAFQKQTDTFAMRHHIRIWSRPGLFNGQPIWVAAATHDIAITLSPVSHSFTHQIDSNIDRERSKVVNDLLFSGHIRGIALVERSNIPPNASNATGDHLETDGRMAVLQF